MDDPISTLRSPMHKLLKDYPLNEWMDAADGCEFCKAKYQVKITFVDETGNFGDVVTRITHEEDCPERYDQGPDYSPVHIGDYDSAGWAYKEKPITFRGLEFYPLEWHANIGPCLICEKLVIRAPLILFIDQGRGGELNFCFGCVEEKGILKEALENAPKLKIAKENLERESS